MIEIVPNWHPVFVHFTLGLLLTAAALFAAGGLLAAPAAVQATVAARWNLWIGSAFGVLALAAGYRAYYTVAHDAPSHAAMLIHLKWAWAGLLLFLAAAALAWRERRRDRGASAVLALLLAAGTAALLVTGYLGGENVYRHGLGVMRLPAAAGPGHDHSHDDGGHSHDGEATAASGSKQKTAKLPEAVAAPAAVIDEFAAALAGGDLDRARRLLDPQVKIFESGNVERSAEEYASHHLHSDSAFLKDARVSLLSRSGDAAGDLAWVATESAIEGVSGGGLLSTETMVLRNTQAGWRIAHIHWSSRPLTPRTESGAN
jgi:uncharacterized membrane protein/ketosteroid isomerase-like protein